MLTALQHAPQADRAAVIAAHPDLAGRLARDGRVTAESGKEQSAAGLDRLNDGEIARFERLNRAYKRRFGFPFVICARANTKESILSAMQARLRNDVGTEVENAVDEIGKIARLRLSDIVTD